MPFQKAFVHRECKKASFEFELKSYISIFCNYRDIHTTNLFIVLFINKIVVEYKNSYLNNEMFVF